MFSLLQKIPCITDLPEETQGLWELCLADVWLPTSVAEWKSTIDSPTTPSPQKTLFMNLPDVQRKALTEIFGFPYIRLPAVPPIESVNGRLPNHFETLCTKDSKLLKQSQVAETVTARVADSLPDLVVFLVLDGLSFYEVVDWTFAESWRVRCEPCLVDGLSVTARGMLRLIGSPCLTHRLFGLGYTQRLGFSYWERSHNRLTDHLFAEFPPTQLARVTTFDEVLQALKTLNVTNRTLIQIVRTGLDGVCHHHREKPRVDALINQLKTDIEQSIDALQHTRKTVRIFVTADHGILWFTNQETIPLSRQTRSPRYTQNEPSAPASTIRIAENGGEIYSVLTGDREIGRTRKVTEWGFHGGVSAQESLVPFLDITPKFETDD